MNYLKKILGELAMALDQIEAELEKRKIEYQGMNNHAGTECIFLGLLRETIEEHKPCMDRQGCPIHEAN